MEMRSNDTKNLSERTNSYLSPTYIRLKIIKDDFSLNKQILSCEITAWKPLI